jgi:methylmalonyl-CoA decarboxylase
MRVPAKTSQGRTARRRTSGADGAAVPDNVDVSSADDRHNIAVGQHVLLSVQEGIGTLTMHDTRRRNTLSSALVEEMVAALAKCECRKLRAIILRAQPGATVWSAGHDILELPETRRDPLGWGDPLRMLVRTLEEFCAPVIALIEGSVWGGACEVALACDMLIATPETTFAITPARLGVPYNASGLLTFMNRIPLSILNEMAFTAEPIDARRAADLGIVNRVVAREEIESFTMGLAQRISRNSPLAVSVMKEQLRLLESAHPLTPEMFERLQGLRRVVYDSQDYREGIHAFLEKRAPVFTGQ